MDETASPVGAPLTIADEDWSSARLHRVRLRDARLRMVDLTGALLRDVDLTGARIEGVIDGLQINGVEIGPAVEAELRRRDPVRGLLRSSEPDDLRRAWALLQDGWAATLERVAAMPAGTVRISVEDEWTFAETLRHLVFATDGWLGAALGDRSAFHPAGLAFTELDEFVPGGAAVLGLDPDAAPSFAEILELRADRTDRVTRFLADATPDRLAEPTPGPPWESDEVTALTCVRVILDEEYEHRRFAERDLDAIAARAEGRPSTG